jgi:zinc transporter, ZIP family
MGFSAGLMLSATALNLIPKALGPNQENLPQAIIGIASGAFILFVTDSYLPHVHGVLIPDKPLTKGMKTAVMLVAALVIHNFPEGFATGTVYASGVTVFSNTVALGVAMQNVPEGVLVSIP